MQLPASPPAAIALNAPTPLRRAGRRSTTLSLQRLAQAAKMGDSDKTSVYLPLKARAFGETPLTLLIGVAISLDTLFKPPEPTSAFYNMPFKRDAQFHSIFWPPRGYYDQVLIPAEHWGVFEVSECDI